MPRLVLIEFNELCPSLLDKWIGEGHLPNFKQLQAASEVFITEADETEPANLEPWIQWYSLHTGLPFSEHKVFHLTDGPAADHDDLWRRLLRTGKTVWNCSSMNARALDDPRAIFLPDPWCRTETPHPSELVAFHRFVSSSVQEYTNADRGSPLSDAVKFLSFLATHGLRTKTVRAVLSQLLSERKTDGASRWKRAALLDKMQFDVFRHYYRARQPDFATFFVNSTAHLQHSYWRCMEPDAFVIKPTAAELAEHSDAILFGYREMDRLIGDFLALAESSGATLMFATALSQQPYLKYEAIGGHNFYRPRRVEKLLADLEIAPLQVLPVMTHQFQLHFRSEVERMEARRRLGGLEVDGKPVFQFDRNDDPTKLYFGCQIRTPVAADARVRTRDNATREFGFFEFMYRIDEIKSGRHHPDGCLWIQTGRHARHHEKVSILDVAPTILGTFGVQAPELSGRNLLATAQAKAA